MKTALYTYSEKKLSQHPDSRVIDENKAQLVLCFGAKAIFQTENIFQLLKDKFPTATIATCSTSGEIYHTAVLDDTLSITAVEFDTTMTRSHSVSIENFTDSYEAGKEVIKKFDAKDLSYVLVLSDGSKVNGSELVRGMNEIAQERFLVTGGLAGDGSNFQSTMLGINDTHKEGLISGIGFYGKKLQLKH